MPNIFIDHVGRWNITLTMNSHTIFLQLISECKEVISAAIIGKYYYQDMTLSVLTADDKARIDVLDADINEFEEDVQSLLSVRI